jgi:hypothetical protein
MKVLAFADLHLGSGGDYGAAPGERLRDQANVLQVNRRRGESRGTHTS